MVFNCERLSAGDHSNTDTCKSRATLLAVKLHLRPPPASPFWVQPIRAVWPQDNNMLFPVSGLIPFHHISSLSLCYLKTADHFKTALPESRPFCKTCKQVQTSFMSAIVEFYRRTCGRGISFPSKPLRQLSLIIRVKPVRAIS